MERMKVIGAAVSTCCGPTFVEWADAARQVIDSRFLDRPARVGMQKACRRYSHGGLRGFTDVPFTPVRKVCKCPDTELQNGTVPITNVRGTIAPRCLRISRTPSDRSSVRAGTIRPVT